MVIHNELSFTRPGAGRQKSGGHDQRAIVVDRPTGRCHGARMRRAGRSTLVAGALLLAAALVVGGCDNSDDSSKPRPRKLVPKPPAKPIADKSPAPVRKPPPAPAKSAPSAKTPIDPKGYTVRFVRPVKPGFRYRLTSVGKTVMKATISGRPSPDGVDSPWNYEADVTVREVNAHGEPTVEQHKVIKFEVTEKAEKSSPVEPGKVIVAKSRNGKLPGFTVGGAPASKAVAGYLSTVIVMSDGGATEDQLFGAKGKKKIGDSWRVNARALARDLRRRPMSLPPRAKNITGTVKLVRAEDTFGEQSLVFKAELKVKNMAEKIGTLKASAGALHLWLERTVPANPESRQTSSTKQRTRMFLEGTSAAGRVTLDMDVERTDYRSALR